MNRVIFPKDFLWGGQWQPTSVKERIWRMEKGCPFRISCQRESRGQYEEPAADFMDSIFTIVTKKILPCLQRWDLRCFDFLLHGPEFSQMEMTKSQMKKNFTSMMMY